MAAAPELAETLLRLLTSPELTGHLDPETRQASTVAWAVLVKCARHLKLWPEPEPTSGLEGEDP